MFIAVEKLWDEKGIQPWGDLTFKKNVLYVPMWGRICADDQSYIVRALNSGSE